MALEIEQKFLEPEMETLQERLAEAGATFCSRHFEENRIFDTCDRQLRAKNILLRMRHAGTTTLTLKRKPDSSQIRDPRFKILEELETSVGDKRSLRKILELLGYEIVFQYEKFRATWIWESCTICLDTLPFIRVVELEGSPESIDQTAQRFGLNKLRTSTQNYVQLYKNHCHALGMPVEDSFSFSKKQRDLLADENDLFSSTKCNKRS